MFKHLKSLAIAAAVVALASPVAACAGTGDAKDYKESKAVVEEEKEPIFTGVLTLAVNTHYVLYGQDIWAGGSNTFNDILFNPSLEFTINLGGNFKLILGTWWDVNSQGADSNIGKYVQEIDLWAGISYTAGPVTFSVIYQEWMYGGISERIVDAKVAVDTFFAPYVLVHARVDGEGLKQGVVGVIGGSHSFDLGPVTFTIPLSAGFATDGFYGGGSGFAYVTTGLGVSAPVPFVPGDWTFGVAANYYHTNDSVIPTNEDDDFVALTSSLTLTF
jgi:hypothetical protein